MEFNACILCKTNPCTCDAAPIVKRSDLKMQQDLNQPSVRDVMREFGERIWKKGRASTLDQVIIELRGRNLHEAADIVAQMKEP